MWFVFGIISSFLMALVLYTDEHLATSNKIPKNGDIHTKIGSVLLVSTLISFVGATILGLVVKNIYLSNRDMALALISGIPMVIMYASYFYLLQTNPVHQVGPLFQISTIWLLVFELFFGGSITLIGLAGILVLMYGAYILDSGTFKWKIPTKLLITVIPATAMWAISLFLARLVSISSSAQAFTFWQLISTGSIGVILFIFVKKYRDGFVYRIQTQGKKFLGLSMINETLSESSFLFSNLAVAIAPVAAYVSAMSGVESLFVLGLFFFFPQGERSKVTKIQLVAIIFIVIGMVLIERN